MNEITETNVSTISIFDTDIELDCDIFSPDELAELKAQNADVKIAKGEKFFNIERQSELIIHHSLKVELSDLMCELYEELRKLRLKIAKEESVRPFWIFTNKSLADMAMMQPVTMAEFADIFGIGEAKLNKYGKQVIELISGYKEKHPELSPLIITIDLPDSSFICDIRSLHKADRKWIEVVIPKKERRKSVTKKNDTSAVSCL